MSLLETALQYARAGVPIVPLNVYFEIGRWRKKPHIKEWAARATTNTTTIEAWWRSWPKALIGVPLEPLNLVVVDCDRHGDGQDGVAALAAIDLPAHQAVVTMSDGEHRFFRQPAPPSPRIRFAAFAGVQVLGDGRLVAAYSLAPFITPAPVLPMDLLERLPRVIRPQEGPHHVGVGEPVEGLLEALRKLDPVDWRGEHDDWLALMNACKFEGIGIEDFVAWSTGDPHYAGDGPVIRQKWKSLTPRHGGALWAALSERGIKLTQPKHTTDRVPLAAKTVSVRKRTDRTCTILAAAKGSMRKEEAWNSACVMAEMVGEGCLHRRVANTLLQSALWMNGLWREDRGLCERIIVRAYAHVKSKMLWNEMP
jgi:hypothetical protein